MKIGPFLGIEKSGELKRYRQTDIHTYIHTYRHFFIAVLKYWDAKKAIKKISARSEKKTDGMHYGIIRPERPSDV